MNGHYGRLERLLSLDEIQEYIDRINRYYWHTVGEYQWELHRQKNIVAIPDAIDRHCEECITRNTEPDCLRDECCAKIIERNTHASKIL